MYKKARISYFHLLSPSLQLSIIIVNYNVRFFLEQCLCSVYKATERLAAEVLVVDNASKDGSVDYLKEKFPAVKFIANDVNCGFATANNQALKQATGEFVLFLNPDTIVPEDCFEKCLSFFRQHPQAGALGIRMVDGGGSFLPESKRSFPSPVTSLFKLLGLSTLFPRSSIFARYSLGYLDEHKNHEVDVLAGAFLMAREALLKEIGGFDETFFMYGEDVDLSYRLQQKGFKNYYFSGSSIIHFKGESTKKGSLNYVKMFYQAMSIFVKKHYGAGRARSFSFFIHLAIWIRAAFAAFFGFIGRLGLPLLDTIIIFGSFQVVNSLWIKFVRHGAGFIEQLVNVSLPGFTIVFLLAATLAGIYDNKYKPVKALLSALVAIVVMLAVYSLLPERFRFSRGVILFGGLTASLFISFFRWVLMKVNMVEEVDEAVRARKTLVVGTKEEYQSVKRLMHKAGLQERVLGRIAPGIESMDAVGELTDLQILVDSLAIREVIFCQGTLSFKEIIDAVQKLPKGISVKFHSEKSESIVGSDSKDGSGESLSHEGSYNLSLPYHRRMKRIIDISLAIFILLTFPVQLLLVGMTVVSSAIKVLVGKKTWVGYSFGSSKLPHIAEGVLSTTGNRRDAIIHLNKESLEKVDTWYAREYDWTQDLKLIVKHYRKL